MILVLIVPQYAQSVQNNNSVRQGCEVNNIAREQFVGLLEDLVEANKVRIKAAGSSESEKEANREAKRAYANRKTLLLATVTPRDPANAAHRDCEEAYPAPFPNSLFE